MQLNPKATTPSAIRRAVAHYDKAAHLDPEYAAEIYYRKAVTAEAERRSIDVKHAPAKANAHRSVLDTSSAAEVPEDHADPMDRRRSPALA